MTSMNRINSSKHLFPTNTKNYRTFDNSLTILTILQYRHCMHRHSVDNPQVYLFFDIYNLIN